MNRKGGESLIIATFPIVFKPLKLETPSMIYDDLLKKNASKKTASSNRADLHLREAADVESATGLCKLRATFIGLKEAMQVTKIKAFNYDHCLCFIKHRDCL